MQRKGQWNLRLFRRGEAQIHTVNYTSGHRSAPPTRTRIVAPLVRFLRPNDVGTVAPARPLAARLQTGKLGRVGYRERSIAAFYPPTPLPVHVLYAHTRQLSPCVRAVIDWMADIIPGGRLMDDPRGKYGWSGQYCCKPPFDRSAILRYPAARRRKQQLGCKAGSSYEHSNMGHRGSGGSGGAS
jgi:hypothetical protein